MAIISLTSADQAPDHQGKFVEVGGKVYELIDSQPTSPLCKVSSTIFQLEQERDSFTTAKLEIDLKTK